MSYTHVKNFSAETPSGQVTSQRSYSASGHVGIAEAIADGQTAFLINLAIDVSEVVSLIIKSDQDITIKTNSSGSPDNTLALEANKEYNWDEDHLDALKLTVDVTKIYVANASGEESNLTIDCIQDATP